MKSDLYARFCVKNIAKILLGQAFNKLKSIKLLKILLQTCEVAIPSRDKYNFDNLDMKEILSQALILHYTNFTFFDKVEFSRTTDCVRIFQCMA